MNIRAVIFDVYGTLLELVSPPRLDAPMGWGRLFHNAFHSGPPCGLSELSAACDEVIARHHKEARARGIAWPEIVWPCVVAEVLTELAGLPKPAQEEFLWQHRQLEHSAQLSIETAKVLRMLGEYQVILGIASNAQFYTLRELPEALQRHGLDLAMFESDLRFWSFAHGFSKPDPHVFQILTTRLAAHGIRPQEILMVGDRLDHDIEPAKAFGWQTWHLTPEQNQDWTAFRQFLLQSGLDQKR